MTTPLTTHLPPGTAVTPDGAPPFPHPGIVAGEPDPATGASHTYSVFMRGPAHVGHSRGIEIPFTRYQEGIGLLAGMTMEGMLAIVMHRLEGYQSGPHACDENAVASEHVEIALNALHERSQRISVERQMQMTSFVPLDQYELDAHDAGQTLDLDEPTPTDSPDA